MFYVYGLIDSNTRQCFYVGKGCKTRMYEHVKKIRRGTSTQNPKLDHKIQKLIRENIEINYVKFYEGIEDEQAAYNLEDIVIREIGLLNLCNVWFGGLGGRVPSDEVRQKISEACKGRVLTEETRLKLSAAKLGTTQSAETKLRKSEKLKGQPQSPAQKAANEKRRQAMTGRKKTDSHREKLRQAKLDNPVKYWEGKNLSPEHKHKIRVAVNKTLELKNDQHG